MSRFARLVFVVFTVAALAVVPAIAQAGPGHGNRCGKGHAKHSRAIGKACSKHRKVHAKRRDQVAPTTTTVPAEVVKKCKEELAAGEAAFQAKYANAAGREALGRCIRLNAGAKDGEDSAPEPAKYDFAAAAQQCAAEKAADADAFVAKYGDESGREAFGHCVRENAKPVSEDNSGDDQGEESGAGDDGEQADAPEQGDDAPAGDDDGTDETVKNLDSLFF